MRHLPVLSVLDVYALRLCLEAGKSRKALPSLIFLAGIGLCFLWAIVLRLEFGSYVNPFVFDLGSLGNGYLSDWV